MEQIAVLHATTRWRRADSGAGLAEELAGALAEPRPLVDRECLAGPPVAAPDARSLAVGRSLLVVRQGDEPLPGWLGQLVYTRRGRVQVDDVFPLPLVLEVVASLDWQVQRDDPDGSRARALQLRRDLIDASPGGEVLAQQPIPWGATFVSVVLTRRPLDAARAWHDRLCAAGFDAGFAVRRVPAAGDPLAPWRALDWEGRP